MSVEFDLYLRDDSPFLPEVDLRSLNSIIRDLFLEQGYYVGEAIAKILRLYGAMEAIRALSWESGQRTITPEDFNEYKLGFDRLLLLLQIAYAGVIEKPGAAERIISQYPEGAERDFLSENISFAVELLEADREWSGIELVNKIVEKKLPDATNLYYKIGLEAARRIFVNYSEILKAIIPHSQQEKEDVQPLLQRLIKYEETAPTSPKPPSKKARQLEAAFAKFAENPSCGTALLIFLRRPDLILGFVSQSVRLLYHSYRKPDVALRETSKVKDVMAKAQEVGRSEWQPGEFVSHLEPEFISLEEGMARIAPSNPYPSKSFVRDIQRIRNLSEYPTSEADATKKLLAEWKQLAQQPGLEEYSALWTVIHIALGDFAEQQFTLTSERRFIWAARRAYSTPLKKSALWKADLGTRCICAARLGELYCKHGSHLEMPPFELARAIHDAYQDALKSNERLYQRSPFRKSKESLQARSRLAVARIIETCVYLNERDKIESVNWRQEAFRIAENNKSRMLREEMTLAERVSPLEIPLTLRDHEKRCLARLREIYAIDLLEHKQDLLPELSSYDELYKEANELRLELEQTWVQMEDFEDAARAYVSARRDEGIGQWDIFQRVAEHLGERVALVSISRLPEAVFLSVLRAGWEAPRILIVPLEREMFHNIYLRSYYDEILNRPLGSEPQDVYTWQKLGDIILAPLESLLTDVELVYFFPHESFYRLPLHALTINGKPFIERWAVVYAPSIHVLENTLSRPKGEGSVLVMGYAPPNHPAKELTKLIYEQTLKGGAYLHTQPILSEDAKADLIEKDSLSAHLIHIACHGDFYPRTPLDSGIHLADKFFTARDWLQLRLRADLVTLCACETGMVDISPGDNPVGLMRAILFAGASSLLMTLCSVEGSTALNWMLKFYKNGWDEKGLQVTDKASVFRKATLELREEYPDPYYWSPFILVGNFQ